MTVWGPLSPGVPGFLQPFLPQMRGSWGSVGLLGYLTFWLPATAQHPVCSGGGQLSQPGSRARWPLCPWATGSWNVLCLSENQDNLSPSFPSSLQCPSGHAPTSDNRPQQGRSWPLCLMKPCVVTLYGWTRSAQRKPLARTHFQGAGAPGSPRSPGLPQGPHLLRDPWSSAPGTWTWWEQSRGFRLLPSPRTRRGSGPQGCHRHEVSTRNCQ